MQTRTRFLICLVGTAAPYAVAQSVTEVLPASSQRSDRIIVIGTGFGALQGSSTLEIGGQPAIISFWSDTRIRAHVPESAPLGPAEVRVLAGDPGNSAILGVLPTAPADGRVLWMRKVDHYYAVSRPAVAADGTIYFTGVGGPLYSIAPDGSINWVFQNAGGVRPATVGPDGTVYVAGGLGSITALSPNGQPQWAYNLPENAGHIFVGPNVGPDGKIYAVTEEEPVLNTDFGAFALHPDGSLAWSTSGAYNHRHGTSGWEIVFADGRACFATGQGFPSYGNNGVHALDIESGNEDWLRVGIAKVQTDTHGNLYWLGAINNNYIGSYEADGDQRWSVLYNQFLGQPGGFVVAPNGVSYYCTSTFSNVAAIEPNGAIRWQYRDFEHLNSIWGVTRDSQRFIGVVFPTDNTAPKLRLWDGADGSVIWEQPVLREENVYMVPHWEGGLSPDGRTYYTTLAGNNYIDDPYSYLIAIDVTAGGPCTADFNTDTQLNFFDVADFLDAFSAADPAADLTSDGIFDFFDIQEFLGRFADGCS